MARQFDAKQIRITLLGAVIVWGCCTGYNDYLEYQVKIYQDSVNSEETGELIKALRFAQEQETLRAKMILQLMQCNTNS
ncbi:hypothetical protein [Shewanella sp. KCT]|uniref:hypothetical protein n=1 Tax=Shewanella sp. KCT TaxID=2569535 RepID=UPI001182E802|nr:hypothetical protein [Shewanella sp. KCT]TVP08747.1 hypothetical protein AYI87_20900 [Shewanella sp. KCT]